MKRRRHQSDTSEVALMAVMTKAIDRKSVV